MTATKMNSKTETDRQTDKLLDREGEEKEQGLGSFMKQIEVGKKLVVLYCLRYWTSR